MFWVVRARSLVCCPLFAICDRTRIVLLVQSVSSAWRFGDSSLCYSNRMSIAESCSAQASRMCPHPNCGLIFKHSQSLKRHYNAIHARHRFFCSYPGCGKSFSYDTGLINHRQSHAITNPQSQFGPKSVN